MQQFPAKRFSGLLICLLMSNCLQAADQISTDRPDAVESSSVVGKGRFQIETSYAVAREPKGSERTRAHATPTLLRFGLSDTLEFRIASDGVVRENTWANGIRTTESGTADVAFGLKWHMGSGPSETDPSMAWLFHIDTPTGSNAFRGHGLRPSVNFVAEWNFGAWSFGIMPGLFVDTNANNQRYTAAQLATVIGKPLTDRIRVFAEIGADQLTSKRHGGNVVNANTGVTYLLSDTVQIDFAVSHGLSSAAPRQQWTTGLSILY